MSDSDSESGRKRILVPIVAIMMCAVAIIGVGYSLTSTVSSNDNSIGVDGLELNLYKTAETTGDGSNIWTSGEIFGNCNIPYAVNTTTAKNSSGIYETTTEYVMTPREVELNNGTVYLGINKEIESGKAYVVTMSCGVSNSIFTEINLYTGSGSSVKKVSDCDADAEGFQFKITSMYTQITLKGMVPETSSSEPKEMSLNVFFSVTDQPVTA